MLHSFFNSLAWSGYLSLLSFFFLSILVCSQPEQQSPQFGKFSFSCYLLLGLVVWPRLGHPFVSQSPRVVCASRSAGLTLGCAYIICSYGQILLVVLVLVLLFYVL